MLSKAAVYAWISARTDDEGVYRNSLREISSYFTVPYKLIQQRVYELRDDGKLTLEGTDIRLRDVERP